MKTSKIKSVQGGGTFESPHGADIGEGKTGFFKHEYEFEDGETLTANHKTQNPFKEGDEIEYVITRTTTYGNQGTVSKPNDYKEGAKKGGYSVDQDAILYQVCLKGVFDYFTAHGETNFEAPQINELALSIAKTAKININLLKQS